MALRNGPNLSTAGASHFLRRKLCDFPVAVPQKLVDGSLAAAELKRIAEALRVSAQAICRGTRPKAIGALNEDADPGPGVGQMTVAQRCSDDADHRGQLRG